jgi:hypothetical protein
VAGPQRRLGTGLPLLRAGRGNSAGGDGGLLSFMDGSLPCLNETCGRRAFPAGPDWFGERCLCSPPPR